MSDPRDDGTARPGPADQRLRDLDAQVRDARARKAGEAPAPGEAPKISPLGQAMRLSTEFMAGILVGGGLGYAVDRWFGTAPWGMIVLLMLGFGAAVTNVVRAAGLMKSRAGDKASTQLRNGAGEPRP